MRVTAPTKPGAAITDGIPRMIRSDAQPASPEAREYFQTAKIIGNTFKLKGSECSQEIAPILSWIPVEAAHGRDRNIRERRHQQACWRRKQVICLFIEAQSLGVEAPSHQEIVCIAGKVVHGETSINVEREPDHSCGLGYASWEARNPSTQTPRP